MRAELEDLYGVPWNGSYNIGCIKGSVAAQARTATDVYVAPGGDDANDGLSAATPMASVQKALAKLADNGTCHLAAGTYTEPIGIYVRGATLKGAGVGQTIIRGKDNPDGTPHPFNIFAAADDVVVRDLTTTAGNAGVRFGYSEFAKRVVVRDCEASGNTNGFYCAAMSLPLNGYDPKTYSLLPDCIDERPTDAVILRCRLTDNRECGLCTTGAGRDSQGGPFNTTIVNSLFARNGEDGVRLLDANQMTHRLYYCTIVDNGCVGLWNGAYNDASYIDAANCVIVGNAVGLQRANYSGAHAEYSLISGNGIDIGTSSGTSQQPTTTACSFAPANLDPLSTRRHYAHLTETSSAIGLARALTADDLIDEPSDDLDHRARKPLKHRDAGCFAYRPAEGLQLIMQ